MKIRIDGKYGGKDAWLEWEDGELDGTPVILESLRNTDKAIEGRPVEPEPYEINRPDLPALQRQPYRILFLCIESCYGLMPIFAWGTAKFTVTDPPESSRPVGAV